MSAAQKPIVMVTGNKNKLAEFKQILGQNFPYEVRAALCTINLMKCAH